MKKIYFLVIVALVLMLTAFRVHPILARETEDDDQATNESQEREEDGEDRSAGEIQEPEDDEQAEEIPAVVVPVVLPPAAQGTLVPTEPDAPVSIDTKSDQPAQLDALSPVAPVVQVPPTISKNFPWAWLITRASGIASYLLLTLLTLSGMLLTTGLLFRIMSPSAAWSLHRAIGSTLLVSVAAHLGGLLLDSFIKLRFADVLIPFVSSYETTLISLGIIGFYLLLIVLGTSLYTMSGHPRLWRALHILGFPMFVLIMLHGLLLGTDRHQAWMLGLYWGSAGLITSALIYRLVWRYRSARPITLSTLSGNQHSL